MNCIDKYEFSILANSYINEINKEQKFTNMKIRKYINLFELLYNNYDFYSNNLQFINITKKKIIELKENISESNLEKHYIEDLIIILDKLNIKLVR